MQTMEKVRTETACVTRDVLSVGLAENLEQLRQAQRLRWQVFRGELNARLNGLDEGLDVDRFDDYAIHVMVRDPAGAVVACTRVIFDVHAASGDGFYAQSEFEMASILSMPGRIMEVGRTCVRQDHRDGAAISVLWSALGRLIAGNGVDYLIGCASVPLDGDRAAASAVLSLLRRDHLSEPRLRVIPRLSLPPLPEPAAGNPQPPPLLKAYLRLGAKVCGEPFWDRDFNVADAFVLVDVARMDPRYMRHFLRRARSLPPQRGQWRA